MTVCALDHIGEQGKGADKRVCIYGGLQEHSSEHYSCNDRYKQPALRQPLLGMFSTPLES